MPDASPRFRTGQRGPEDFVPAPDGSLDFGAIDAEVAHAIGGEAAPIRLQEGRHDAKTGTGFGRVHIEEQRGAEIRQAGHADVAALVADVASGYRQVARSAPRASFIIASGVPSSIGLVLDEKKLGEAHGRRFFRKLINSLRPRGA